jgi:hypothetical protein
VVLQILLHCIVDWCSQLFYHMCNGK